MDIHKRKWRTLKIPYCSLRNITGEGQGMRENIYFCNTRDNGSCSYNQNPLSCGNSETNHLFYRLLFDTSAAMPPATSPTAAAARPIPIAPSKHQETCIMCRFQEQK